MRNMKRILSAAAGVSLAAALLTTSAFAAAGAAKKFTDVPENHWAAADIARAVERGFMQGTSDTEFSPDMTVDYSQFLTMLVRQFYSSSIGEAGEHWYDAFVVAAKNQNILEGVTMKSPLASINRFEMAQIMFNVMKANGIQTTPLSDTSVVADWATVPKQYQQALSVCYNMGLISGVDAKGSFGGSSTMTRAQAAVVMNRLIDAKNSTPVKPAEQAVAPVTSGTKITKLSQLRTLNGAVECEGGFYFDTNKVGGYQTCALSINTSGHKKISFTYTAGSTYTELTVEARTPGFNKYDPPITVAKINLNAGESKTLTYDCSGWEVIGIGCMCPIEYANTHGISGLTVDGYVTNIVLQ